jgi:hypothetical protein
MNANLCGSFCLYCISGHMWPLQPSATQPLRMANGLVSQWLSVGEFRSCFCVASQSVPSAWIIEGRLPNGDNVQLASYETDLFDPANPRYVTMKAMCGLPIRFVATVQRVSHYGRLHASAMVHGTGLLTLSTNHLDSINSRKSRRLKC